jgi:hypothetical protein
VQSGALVLWCLSVVKLLLSLVRDWILQETLVEWEVGVLVVRLEDVVEVCWECAVVRQGVNRVGEGRPDSLGVE